MIRQIHPVRGVVDDFVAQHGRALGDEDEVDRLALGKQQPAVVVEGLAAVAFGGSRLRVVQRGGHDFVGPRVFFRVEVARAGGCYGSSARSIQSHIPADGQDGC